MRQQIIDDLRDASVSVSIMYHLPVVSHVDMAVFLREGRDINKALNINGFMNALLTESVHMLMSKLRSKGGFLVKFRTVGNSIDMFSSDSEEVYLYKWYWHEDLEVAYKHASCGRFWMEFMRNA